MKLLWNGTLTYGIAVPVELYQPQKKSFIFKLVHNKCFFEIKESQWCNHCDERIKTDEIIKQICCGRFKENLKNSFKQVEPGNNIDILELVEAELISNDEKQYPIIPSYIDSNYFLFLGLIETLNKAALGNIVLNGKKYFCIINRAKNQLFLKLLTELKQEEQ